MQMMIAEVARDDMWEERARKRLTWLDRHYRMEAEESMEVDVLTRDVTLDVDGDTIMTDQSGRKSNFVIKSKKKFRSRMLEVTDMVKELGWLREMDEPLEITTSTE